MRTILFVLLSAAMSSSALAQSGACMPTPPEDPNAPGERPGVGPYDAEDNFYPGILGEIVPDIIQEALDEDREHSGLFLGVGAGNRHCYPENHPLMRSGN